MDGLLILLNSTLGLHLTAFEVGLPAWLIPEIDE
jgi:hypothetical protein